MLRPELMYGIAKQEYGITEGFQRALTQSKPSDSYITGGGRGVILVGGGKYWPGIFVAIKMLRKVGWTLPIEVWYRGECEKVYPDQFETDASVSFIDIDAMSKQLQDSNIPTGIVRSGGWEAKLYAMTHTKLDQVMYLDADAYCVENPTKLFDLLSKDAGFLFWRDLPQQERTVKWPKVYPAGPGKVMQVQGGQLFIDRNVNWKTVELAHYICQHSSYYFKHMYGDQDAWRVALAATGDTYKELGNANWISPAFVCQYDRVAYVVHRCQGKMFTIDEIPKGKPKFSNPQYHLPKEAEAFDYFAEVLNKTQTDAYTVFRDVYQKKLWGVGSGAGSDLKQATPYIETVNSLIESNGWKSVVDLGCGDGLVGSKIICQKYLGVDCYPTMLRRNKDRYKLEYLPLDIYKNYDIIPNMDVVLCKDVLHHWPTEWVETWLTALIESNKFKAIILCQDMHQKHDNQDCGLGGYRALNVKLSPLNKFPVILVREFLHKQILLWTNPNGRTSEQATRETAYQQNDCRSG